MKKQILFVTVLIVISTSTIFGQDIKFPELNLPDSMKNKQTNPAVAKKDDDAEIKKQALEFFNAVLNEDVETIFKYVHPQNISGELTKKFYIEEIIKPQLKDLAEKGGFLKSVVILSIEELKDAKSSQTLIKHTTMVAAPDGEVEFQGLMKVYTVNGKNYFIGNKAGILESFGIAEFNESEKDTNAELEKQALEFFKAVLDMDAETIFKYVHPQNLTDEMTKKTYIKKVIKPQLKTMKKDKVYPISIEISGLEMLENSAQIVIRHKTIFTTSDGDVEFEGLMKVYTVNEKNYFIGNEVAILESFGLQGLDETEEDEEISDSSKADSDTINKGVLNGNAISLPAPKYPKAARAANITGAVNVEVVIDKNGKVTSAKAVSGPPLLQKAAEKAALEAKSKPTTLSGQAVEVSGIIIYNFTN